MLATFGAGCFWHVQEVFSRLPGVKHSSVGFMGGTTKNPSYNDVCTDTTGHAEVVQLTWDPKMIDYEELVTIFFSIHDPSSYHRQGLDVGSQYRSVIFTHSPEQEAIAKKIAAQIQTEKPICTEILPATEFYPAEEYHQDFLKKCKLSY